MSQGTVLKVMKKKRYATSKQIAEMLEISDRAVTRSLGIFVKQGIVEKIRDFNKKTCTYRYLKDVSTVDNL